MKLFQHIIFVCFLITPATAQPLPEPDDLAGYLAEGIPSYWSINEFRSVTQSEIGDPANFPIIVRFEADAVPTGPLYTTVGEQEPFAIIVPTWRHDETRILYGVMHLSYRAGEWASEVEIENPVDGIGLPRDLFVRPTLILGDSTADQHIARLRAMRIETAEREHTEALSQLRATRAANVALKQGRVTLEQDVEDIGAELIEAQRQIEESEIRTEELTARLLATQELLGEQLDLRRTAEGRVDILDQETLDLRNQLDRVESLLAASEEQVDAQAIEIAQLEGRLNQALLREVEELAQYRSEFLSQLRQALGGREDVRVVGDRFIFQSEVLFPTGSADLQPGGQMLLAELADELIAVAEQFPPGIDWLLRVDGHTDTVPISTPEFPSNWELSAARALEVVKFLADQGIPESRLVAAGFGEHQPIVRGTSSDALARNRRIELLLDRPASGGDSNPR